MSHLEFAEGVRLFILDNNGVVFSEPAQEIYALNTAATFVWCQIELGETLVHTKSELAKLLDCSMDEAERHVTELLDRWHGSGLFAGDEIPAPPSKSATEDAGAVRAEELPPYETPTVVRERCYELLTSLFVVRFTSAAQEEWIHPVLGHLETPKSTEGARVVDIVENSGRLCIYRDQEPLDFCTKLNELAPRVKGAIWQSAVNGYEYFLDIHAGVVGDGTQCILLPAPAGSGKSTLTAALCHAGFEFFSDEVALLEKGTFSVRPTPLSFCFKSTGWDVVEPFFPQMKSLRSHLRGDGKIVRYARPSPDRCAEPGKSYPVGHIVFPRYAPDQVTLLGRLRKVDALVKLMEECLVVPDRLTVKSVSDLVAWIELVPCYQLPMASLDLAVASICDLVRTDEVSDTSS